MKLKIKLILISNILTSFIMIRLTSLIKLKSFPKLVSMRSFKLGNNNIVEHFSVHIMYIKSIFAIKISILLYKMLEMLSSKY
jgi:hypothetical protein